MPITENVEYSVLNWPQGKAPKNIPFGYTTDETHGYFITLSQLK